MFVTWEGDICSPGDSAGRRAEVEEEALVREPSMTPCNGYGMNDGFAPA